MTDNLSEAQRAAIEAAVKSEVEQWLAIADDMFITINRRLAQLEYRVLDLERKDGAS